MKLLNDKSLEKQDCSFQKSETTKGISRNVAEQNVLILSDVTYMSLRFPSPSNTFPKDPDNELRLKFLYGVNMT